MCIHCRDKGAVVGILKVGKKKLFLVVSITSDVFKWLQ